MHPSIGGKLASRSCSIAMQVARHDVPEDLWVAFLGKVVDLTSLVLANPGTSRLLTCGA
jgi:hypothetical protein